MAIRRTYKKSHFSHGSNKSEGTERQDQLGYLYGTGTGTGMGSRRSETDEGQNLWERNGSLILFFEYILQWDSGVKKKITF